MKEAFCMVVNKGTVTVDRKAGSAGMQLMSEGDITGFGDIGTLLKWNNNFVVDSTSASEGRVSFNGRLKISGMYLSRDDSGRVRPFSYELPVSDFVSIDGADEHMNVYISCTPASCELKVSGGGKINYKALTDVQVTLREQAECEYIESIEDIPLNMQRFTSLSPETAPVFRRDSFTVKDSLVLPMGKPNIEELLDVSIRLTSTDFKPSQDSMRISGDLSVSVLYKGEGESNPMELYEGVIPFKGELDAEGLKSDMLCDVRLELSDSYVTVQTDEDGEMRLIDTEAIISALITGREAKEIRVLEDAYILNKTTRLTTEQVEGSVTAPHSMSQCPVKEIVELDESAPGMLQIYKADGRPYIDFVQINDGKIEIEGAVAVDILYVTGDDGQPVYCFGGVVPFKHIAQASGAQNDMDCSVYAQLEHIGFNMISDREVEVRCIINICACAEDTRLYDFVSDAAFEDIDGEELSSLASITLYVVHKGDTLWKLAKRFNTTVEDIASINDIENPDLIYPGQRLIIVKRVG